MTTNSLVFLQTNNLKVTALIMFIAMYALLLFLPKKRPFIAVATASLFLFLGMTPLKEAFTSGDSWNVILMIAGTMGTVALFIDSKMPSLLADMIIEKTPNVKWAIFSLALFSGLISAFIDNVATVLIIAPVALTISKKLNISPIPSIIAISIASNLQGAATLVGDTTSILLGVHANLDFLDFFFTGGRFGIFWVVEAGAIAATLILLIVFRRETQKITSMDRTKVHDYFPSFLLLSIIGLLIIASFFPNKPSITNGLICVSVFFVGLIRTIFIRKQYQLATKAIKEIDYQTLVLLAGLFIVIAGMDAVGIVSDIGNLFLSVGNNVFILYTIIVWGSVLVSAFIDNIPYIMTMLPVISAIVIQRGDIHPNLLYFGLLIGATLGGNITPIGASANITGIGILRRSGYEVSVGTFMKISVPFTLAAVTVGYLLNWLIWS